MPNDETTEAKRRRIDELMCIREREDPLCHLPYEGTEVTLLEHQRAMMLKRLEQDPTWEPPRRWCSGILAEYIPDSTAPDVLQNVREVDA